MRLRNRAWPTGTWRLAVAVLVATSSSSVATRAEQDVAGTRLAPAFEVASIRVAGGNSGRRDPIDESIEAEFGRSALAAARNGRFSATGITLHVLIQMAYGVRAFQIQGGPSWIRSERYVIEARSPGTTTLDEVRGMLRSLLAERFKVTLHRERQPRPVYELRPARNGLNITPMREGGCIAISELTAPVPLSLAKPLYLCDNFRRLIVTLPPDRTDRIEAGGIEMSFLTGLLSDDLGRLVIDRTGFTERFNLLLDFAPTLAGGGTGAPSGPTIFTALEEQLGMVLRAASAPVDLVVIDGAEHPSDN